MSQQAAAVAIGRQADSAKPTAVDMWNSVVMRQPFIQERIIGLQQIDRTAIFAENALDKQFRFAFCALSQVVIEVRKLTQVRRNGIQVPQVQPCLLYTSPSPRDATLSRMPSSA